MVKRILALALLSVSVMSMSAVGANAEVKSNTSYVQADATSSAGINAVKARQLIYTHDGVYLNELKAEGFNLQIANSKETTIKQCLKYPLPIADEPCYQFIVYDKTNSMKTKEAYQYLVGKNTGNVYAVKNQRAYASYQVKNNGKIKIFEDPTIPVKDMINRWHFSKQEFNPNIYDGREVVKYNGEWYNGTFVYLEDKKSIEFSDAIHLIIDADGLSLYKRLIEGMDIELSKSKEGNIKDIVKGRWNIPNEPCYYFDLMNKTDAKSMKIEGTYVVGEDSKKVYFLPAKDKENASRLDRNKTAETYKFLK